MIPRTIEKKLTQVAAQYPVVTLTGPRQSGKTTLIRALFSSYDYVSLEDPEQRTFALEDPRGFLEQFSGNVILDEVQRAPDLFSYIQVIVDEKDIPGQFILSGSQNFLLLKSISQSLAGRCAVLHLLPFSVSELFGYCDFPLIKIGKEILSDRIQPDIDLFSYLFTGSFPRIHDKKLDPQEWLKNYFQTYIERDVRDIINVGDLESFQRFVSLCAGRTGQLVNFSSLSTDCGITHTTATRWLSILETSFIVVRLYSFHKNFNKRLVKSPKLYFIDTGLLCYLLRIRHPEDLHIHASRGAIFESFVVSEMYKKAFHTGRNPDLYFWRDSGGHEVDMIIDRGMESTAIEIKSGKTITADYFKGLEFWKTISGSPNTDTCLIYAGDRSVRQKGMAVYSWFNF